MIEPYHIVGMMYWKSVDLTCLSHLHQYLSLILSIILTTIHKASTPSSANTNHATLLAVQMVYDLCFGALYVLKLRRNACNGER